MTEPEGQLPAETEVPSLPPGADEIIRGAFGESGEILAQKLAESTGKSEAEIITSLSYWFTGPHPHPGMLAAYERVLPGLADRIVRQGESQTAHRQAIERQIVQGQLDQQKEAQAQGRLGLWLAAVVLVIFAGLAAGLGFGGHTTAAGILGGGAAALAAVFVYGSRGLRRNGSGAAQEAGPSGEAGSG